MAWNQLCQFVLYVDILGSNLGRNSAKRAYTQFIHTQQRA